MLMDNIPTESQLFVLHMKLVHMSRLFSERPLNPSDTVKPESETLEYEWLQAEGL